MAAAKLNLIVEQGATFDRTVTWKIGATPVNLTDYSARLQARASCDAADPIIDLSSEDGGGITLGGSAGTIDWALSADATALLTPGDYVYDLEVEHTGGTVRRLLEGRLTVTPEVTK